MRTMVSRDIMKNVGQIHTKIEKWRVTCSACA
jgi:hypothetical protein